MEDTPENYASVVSAKDDEPTSTLCKIFSITGYILYIILLIALSGATSFKII